MVSRVWAEERGGQKETPIHGADGSTKALPCPAASRTITVPIALHTPPPPRSSVLCTSAGRSCERRLQTTSKPHASLRIALTVSTSAPPRPPLIRWSVAGHQDAIPALAQRPCVVSHAVWDAHFGNDECVWLTE